MKTQDVLSLIVLPIFVKTDSGLASGGSPYISDFQDKLLLRIVEFFKFKQQGCRIILPKFSNLEFYTELLKENIGIDIKLYNRDIISNDILISPYLNDPFIDGKYVHCDNGSFGLTDKTLTSFQYCVNELRDLLKVKLIETDTLQDSLPTVAIHKIQEAKNLLVLAEDTMLVSQTNQNDSSLALSRHSWEILLGAHTILDACLKFNIDPVQGWVLKHKFNNDSQSSVTTPFIYSIFKNTNDQPNSYPNLYYTPRKLLLSNTGENFCLKFRDEDHKWQILPDHSIAGQYRIDTTSSLMRNSPDLYGIKFKRTNSRINSYQVLYLRSNLGSFEKESTSGFQTDFWLEEVDSSIDPDTEISFYVRIIFPGIPDIISFRYLTSLGGHSSKLIQMENKIVISPEDKQGTLNGLRIIDGLNHFITDLRLFSNLKAIEIDSLYLGSGLTQIDTHFIFPQGSKSKLNDIQSFFLSIY